MTSSIRSIPPLVVGLTGGIGSGKTAASNYFSRLGVDIIDTDLISRYIVQPGFPALTSISEKFGDDIILQDGSLNRALLRQRIFGSPPAQKWLEQLLHPLIRQQAATQLQKSTSAYAILVVPLLAENWPYPYINRALVIDSSVQRQIERACARDKMSESQAQKIIDSQASRQSRLAIADDVVLNEGSVAELETKLDKLHQQYLILAQD